MSEEKNPVKVKRIVATNSVEQSEPSRMQIKGNIMHWVVGWGLQCMHAVHRLRAIVNSTGARGQLVRPLQINH